MRAAPLILSILVIVAVSGCIGPASEYCMKSGTGYGLSLEQARDIGIKGQCGDRLKETAVCNEVTGTWWIDLDVEREGCNPACVVDVVTNSTSINWRCTGLIPPGGGGAGMANPASIYCQNMGYAHSIREGPEGSAGYCVAPGGGECPEWEYLRGECSLAGEKDYAPQECVNMGGSVTNIVGGGSCEENRTRAGRVTGFITPNICCVPV